MARLAGFEMPRLGMGTMALAIEGRPESLSEAIDTIHAGLDAGVRYLDTAWSYYLPTRPPFGTSDDFGYGEWLVSQALHSWDGPRDEILIATKTGFWRSCDISGTARLPRNATETTDATNATNAATDSRPIFRAEGSRYGWVPDGRPETIARQARESARRLGVDTLDLIYSHGPDPQVPYEEQMEAFRQLIDDGVTRYVGVSRVNNEQINIARSVLGDSLIAVQNQFSPSYPDPDRTMAHCRELGLAFVCWSPLGGFLDPVDQRAYDRFRDVAAERDCSYQRVVLAWEMTRYDRLFTIPSARNPHEIKDSFAATALSLSDDELRYLTPSRPAYVQHPRTDC
ncbi:aldo/keto reductase family oxidoreductase [Bifidobacterium margollesii]|uniref:Aldo/keto reductase family oxidoreductase n=1 Tax=Bifidobacterium margollesii TaxID=2020964 RepID=A0A2N5JCD7_9BIFI|nr:aldo/keto reductase [Bifidobacterium margollesii]PLS31849.1 aldo/keto reductase family oxidoreductase [Bifidobacterium margollesii]